MTALCSQLLLLSTLSLLANVAGAYAPTPNSRTRHRSLLFAAGGSPQYDKRNAKLRHAEVVGDGSVMLHIDKDDDDILDYKPGHVLALEIEDVANSATATKNMEDTAKNGGWMRGPYTISRSSDTSFDILIKVVGDKSKRLATAPPGTPLKFGGKFKVPIYEGI